MGFEFLVKNYHNRRFGSLKNHVQNDIKGSLKASLQNQDPPNETSQYLEELKSKGFGHIKLCSQGFQNHG